MFDMNALWDYCLQGIDDMPLRQTLSQYTECKEMLFYGSSNQLVVSVVARNMLIENNLLSQRNKLERLLSELLGTRCILVVSNYPEIKEGRYDSRDFSKNSPW